MLKHIIMWKLKDGMSAEEISAAKEKTKSGLENLAGKIDGLVDIKVEINPLDTSNMDMMLVSTMRDKDALAAYAVNPLHVAVATYIRSVVSARNCMDFEI